MDLANTPHKIVNGEPVALSQAEIEEIKSMDELWAKGESDRKMTTIREQRKLLLQETDYIMLADYNGVDRDEWIAYRQSLRDITKQDLSQPIGWPEKPTKKG